MHSLRRRSNLIVYLADATIYSYAWQPGRTSSPPLEPRSTPKAPGSMSNFLKIESQITEVRAEIKAQNSRIDVLQRVIWPLIGLLATTVFGLLYRVVIVTPG